MTRSIMGVDQERSDQNKSHKKRILIMVNSKIQADKLEYLLNKHGFEPVIAESIEAAIEHVKQKAPDLILSEIIMPEMNGYSFCRKIRSYLMKHNIPVIFLSDLTDTHDILKGLECGVSNFITKPYKDDELINIIEEHLKAKVEPEQDQDVVKITFEGREYNISASKSRILEILMTTYETAINKNKALVHTQGELKYLNQQLEEQVNEKTADLQEEIVEREKIETELYKLTNVVHQAKNIIVITDLEGNIEYANPFFTDITGYTLEEVKGRNPRILKSGEHDDAFYKNIWETVLAGKEWKGEFINKAKNGDLIYENASIFDIRDPNGKVLRLAKIAEDITLRKQKEFQIEKLYSLLMEDMELASSVQSYLLPYWLVHENNISVASVYSPSEKLGGDVFDIIQVSASKYVIYIGDISGHGVQAALIMTAVKSTINMLVNMEKDNVRPYYVINKLNEIMGKDFFQTNYLTIIFSVVDLETNLVRYLNAGHPAPIEYNKLTSEIRIIDSGSSIPVGWIPSYKYEEKEEIVAEMSPDSIYFLYTDGLFECMNLEGEELGICGFTDFLKKFSGNMNSLILPSMIKQLLIEEHYNLKGDDFTLLKLQKFDNVSMQNIILLKYTKKNFKAMSRKVERFIRHKFNDHSYYLIIDSIIADYLNNIAEKHSQGKDDSAVLMQMKIEPELILTFWQKTIHSRNNSPMKEMQDHVTDRNNNKYPLQQNIYDEIVETIINIPIK